MKALGDHLVARTAALLARFPHRLTGTAGERGLQDACADELRELGGVVEWQKFRWGQSIYASLAFHFGLATAALVIGFWWPLPAAALHVVVAISYASESVRKRPLLRWALPTVRSQNAIVTFPARRPLAHRIVTLAHADAAYTGVLFTPSIVRMAAKETKNPIGRAFRKGLAVATFSLVLIAIVEVLEAWRSPSPLTIALAVVLSIPSFAAFVLNLDVVIRNHVVPAANDNLSGCVATLELARRLRAKLPDDIELVTVITGCEEAGAGGATSLAYDVIESGRWSTDQTTVLALDTFSGGDVRLLQEGELWGRPLPPKLVALTEAVCRAVPAVGPVPPYEIPSGATDAWPFLIGGYESMAITCIDPSLGAPRHYHRPSDTAENLDALAFARSYSFTEHFVMALARERSRLRVDATATHDGVLHDEKNHRADEGDEHAVDVEARHAGRADHIEEEAAEHRADDAEHDVQDGAFARLVDDLAGDESGDEAEHDPGENGHLSFPSESELVCAPPAARAEPPRNLEEMPQIELALRGTERQLRR